MPSCPTLLLIDIDGLRQDVFDAALEDDRISHIARLLGGPGLARGMQISVLAPAPSITFCSQVSLFTGTHPSDHGIPAINSSTASGLTAMAHRVTMPSTSGIP